MGLQRVIFAVVLIALIVHETETRLRRKSIKLSIRRVKPRKVIRITGNCRVNADCKAIGFCKTKPFMGRTFCCRGCYVGVMRLRSTTLGRTTTISCTCRPIPRPPPPIPKPKPPPCTQ